MKGSHHVLAEGKLGRRAAVTGFVAGDPPAMRRASRSLACLKGSRWGGGLPVLYKMREHWYLPVLGSSASPAKPPHIANLHYSAHILAVAVVWCVVEKIF